MIEEIVLKTKSKCLILDPNADFKKIYDLVDESNWRNISYSHEKKIGKLPTEKSQDNFKKKWDKINKIVISANYRAHNPSFFKKLSLWWPSINIDLIATYFSEFDKPKIHDCHNFVRLVEYLYIIGNNKNNQTKPFSNFVEETFLESKEKTKAEFLLYLNSIFPPEFNS